jgi:hypothetical protein
MSRSVRLMFLALIACLAVAVVALRARNASLQASTAPGSAP